MDENFKRINVLITQEQYQQVLKANLSLSGLIRDLLDDRFSDTRIVLSLGKETKKLYDYVISNFAVDDRDLEPQIIEALDKFLESKTKEIGRLRKKIAKRSSAPDS